MDIKAIKALRARAHHLRPIVTLGQHGASESVLAELDRALHDHELVKVKLPALNKAERDELVELLRSSVDGLTVQTVGRICVLYRESTLPLLTRRIKKKAPVSKKTKKKKAARAKKPTRIRS